MITTYAISLSTVDCGEEQRTALVDLVTDWQMAAYPYDPEDGYRPGVTVRSRYAFDDPVFRVTITDGLPSSSHIHTTTCTVVLVDGLLTFDLRIVSLPNSTRVAPHQNAFVPPHVVDLVRRVIEAVPTYDAERRMVDNSAVAETFLDGEEIAHFVLAPGRRMPVLVEVADTERNSSPLMAIGPGPLVGLVHMVLLRTPEAVRGYAEVLGDSLIGPGYIAIHWSRGSKPEEVNRRQIAPASEPALRDRLARLIIDSAARSVGAPRVPPPPRRDLDIIESPTRDGDDDTQTGDEDMAAYVEQLEAEKNELEAALSVSNQMIAEQQSRLEQRSPLSKDQIDNLIAENVWLQSMIGKTPKLTGIATMRDAMRVAQDAFDNLVFHPRAIESGCELQGPDPGAVLDDLRRLNNVARKWKSGEISGASITSACLIEGLKYAPGIGDVAREKYAEDYLIDWRGKQVVAGAHIKRGKKSHLVRIHVYFDEETHQVVVAYIGRHLRDKSSG